MRDALEIQRTTWGQLAAALPRHGSHRLRCRADLRSATEVVFLPTMAFSATLSLWFEQYRSSTGNGDLRAELRVRARARAGQRVGPDRWDLSCCGRFGCGAEPTNPKIDRELLRCSSRPGLRPESFLPCYGMAEATLATAFPRSGEGMRVDVVDELAYRQKRDRLAGRIRPGQVRVVGAVRPSLATNWPFSTNGASKLPNGRSAKSLSGPSVTDGISKLKRDRTGISR